MIKCDPRARAKCELKKACCGDEVAYFVEGSLCDAFNQRVLSERPITNADRIRAMTDEELAEWLKEMWDCNLCPAAERLDDHPLLGDEQCDQNCAQHCLEWLQRPCKN